MVEMVEMAHIVVSRLDAPYSLGAFAMPPSRALPEGGARWSRWLRWQKLGHG